MKLSQQKPEPIPYEEQENHLPPSKRKAYKAAYRKHYYQHVELKRNCKKVGFQLDRTDPDYIRTFLEKRTYYSIDGCHYFTGCLNSWGYGVIQFGVSKRFFGGKQAILAHRASYELRNGKILNALCVLHHCDNPACINPDHLYAGTNYQNVMDRVRRNRGNRPIGTKAANAVLNEQIVLEIRKLSESMSAGKISKKLGFNKSTIKNVIKRRAWKHI